MEGDSDDEVQSLPEDSDYRPPRDEELSVDESAATIAERLARSQQRRGAASTPARQAAAPQGAPSAAQGTTSTPARPRSAVTTPHRTVRQPTGTSLTQIIGQ